MHKSQDIQGKSVDTKYVYHVDYVPKVSPNIPVMIKGEIKSSNQDLKIVTSEFIELEKEHLVEIISPTAFIQEQ